MKNLLFLATFSIGVLASNATNLANNRGPEPANQKVVKTFNDVFKNAENVQWGTNDQLNVASFTTGAVRVTAILDNKGNLVRTIRYYKENDLPANILFRIKKKYHFQEVWGVTEVSNANGTRYLITLKDAAYWYHVKANAQGEISLQSKTDRGDI